MPVSLLGIVHFICKITVNASLYVISADTNGERMFDPIFYCCPNATVTGLGKLSISRVRHTECWIGCQVSSHCCWWLSNLVEAVNLVVVTFYKLSKC